MAGIPPPHIQQKILDAVLQIPFVQRTEMEVQEVFDEQVWKFFMAGEIACEDATTDLEDYVKAAVKMPTYQDVYMHYLNAVKTQLSNIRKPTLLQVCMAADEAMRTYPVRGSEYEVTRRRIIQEIDCDDDICEVCGCRIDVKTAPIFGGKYCSKWCWSRSDE